MHSIECITIKILPPTARKAAWLEKTADNFSKAVQFGLDMAQDQHTSNRNKIHQAVYHESRARFALPAHYARMVVNGVVSLARSYYGLRRSQHIRRVSFPKINGNQNIGLGVGSYKIFKNGNRFALRVSTGKRGIYIWLVLCVPAKYYDRLLLAKGDARLFKRDGNWYVSLPIRVTPTPTICDGEPTFIGIDLGIVRLATVSTPDRTVYFSGKAARWKREHFANLRRRYQHHRRTDRVKAARGKERRWTRDLNHKISVNIIAIALQYPRPVIVLERLDGIRNRLTASKRFNRMMSSWSFRQLINMIEYKSAREGIPIIFIDPRGTSKTCSKCGHNSRSNRREQANFQCAKCDFQENADANAALNIARAGSLVWREGQPDNARPNKGQTGEVASQPDGVKECALVAHSDSNLSFSVRTRPF